MKKMLALDVMLALALAAPVAGFAASADPGAAVKADVAKLLADAQAKHDTIVADAQQLQADVQSLRGATDKAAAKAAVKADLDRLRADRDALAAALKPDRERLAADMKVALGSQEGRLALRGLLKQTIESLKQERQSTRAAIGAARQAEQAVVHSFRK
jgi:hypothetical protein